MSRDRCAGAARRSVAKPEAPMHALLSAVELSPRSISSEPNIGYIAFRLFRYSLFIYLQPFSQSGEQAADLKLYSA